MPPKISGRGRGRPRKSDGGGAAAASSSSKTAAKAGAKNAKSTASASRKGNNGAGRKRRRDEEEGLDEDEEDELLGEQQEADDDDDDDGADELLEDPQEVDDEDEEDELLELPSTTSVAAKAAVPSSSSTGKKAVKKRASEAVATGSRKKRQKKRHSEADDASVEGGWQEQHKKQTATAKTKSAKFAHLKPRTRQIPASVITTKWRPAPLPSQAAARALFVAAKRPVVEAAGRKSSANSSGAGAMGDGYDRRKAEAEATLAGVLRKLDKKIPRIPFPPMKGGTSADAFELEKVVERNRTVEAQLTPAVHAVRLLREAVAREEDVLEREKEALEVLEARAREAERRGRERGKKALHPALKIVRAGGKERGDSVDDIRLVAAGDRAEDGNGETELEGDEQLAPVLEQLQGHLESMRANLEQVEGLDEAMSGARGALDGVLRGRLDEERYDGLLSSSS